MQHQGWCLYLHYTPNPEDECARRNAKLVATHLINDTCLNALKWPHKPTYMLTLAPDLHGSTRGCQTMTSNYPSARPPAPPRHTGHPPLTQRQRPCASQTDSSRAIWRGAAQSVGLPLHSARHTHASHSDRCIQYVRVHTRRYPASSW